MSRTLFDRPNTNTPSHTPALAFPYNPRRRGGIVIADTPVTRPVLGDSPLPQGKGKKILSGCKPLDPTVQDYDSDDSDEGSFERALNAIHNIGREVGSSSGVTPLPGAAPPPSSSHPLFRQNAAGRSIELHYDLQDMANWQPPSTLSDNDSSVPPAPGIQQQPVTPTSHTEHLSDHPAEPDPDSENEIIADIVDRLIDAEPLSTRAKRLQAKKMSMHAKRHLPSKPPIPKKQVTFTTLSSSRRPASKSPSRANSSKHSTRTGQSIHLPRSPTKKICSASASAPPPHTPEVIEISDTSTKYPPDDDQTWVHAWRYNPNIPRRSFRVQMQHTQTPILKRAQKRKTTSTSTIHGNPLLQKIPYNRFTLEKIIHLFGIYNITLGKDTQERELLILAMQKLTRSQFEQLLHTLNLNTHSRDSQFIHLTDLSLVEPPHTRDSSSIL